MKFEFIKIKEKRMSEMSKEELLEKSQSLAAMNEKALKEIDNLQEYIRKFEELYDKVYPLALEFKDLNFWGKLVKGLRIASEVAEFILNFKK